MQAQPPVGDYGYSNSSGQGPNAVVPDQIRGFNWGAFLMNWIWTLGNASCGMAVLSFVLSAIPVVNLGWAIYLGLHGNEIAWRSKPWQSVEHFKATQRKWTIAGVILLVLGLLFACLLIALGGVASLMSQSTGTSSILSGFLG